VSLSSYNGYLNSGQRILQNTFDGIESVMHHQLLKGALLGKLDNEAFWPIFREDVFIPDVEQISDIVGVVRSTLSIPAWMVSIPAAFPFLSALMADLTSALVGGLMSMPRTSTEVEGLAGSSGSGL